MQKSRQWKHLNAICIYLWLTCKNVGTQDAYYNSNDYGNSNYDDEKGLFPPTLNLASSAIITTNATCGDDGPEVFCKLVEHVFMREPQCGVCDSSSNDRKKRHVISNAIDGSPDWWQSPTLQNGKKYEWVTITLDLGQVFQVAYVIVKAANSPRPGNWILERSTDGSSYKPWQYYAISDAECKDVYGVSPTIGIPRYMSDDEIICTSYYSKLNPLENGEIHTSLVNGRPGVTGPSEILQEFTTARYVRLRLQRIRTLNADLMTLSNSDSKYIDKSVTRRYFYSIKDISIGGHCMCFGHARDCPADPITGQMKCRCVHNSCGFSCEKCCPLYNQKPWQLGTTVNAGICEKCQCYGHSDECVYDAGVAEKRQSLDIHGNKDGGGVCLQCRAYTTGVNCEQCIEGYYRPLGVPRDSRNPCVPCVCSGAGAMGHCIKDDTHAHDGYLPGACICRSGFSGPRCDMCSKGHRRYPTCEPCPCNFAGTVNMDCEGDCVCKKNVEGIQCDVCKPGFYNLDENNIHGCTSCFCFGVTTHCNYASNMVAEAVVFTRGWLVTDLASKRVIRPMEEGNYFTIANDDMLGLDIYFWLAPKDYLGNKLNSFGTKFIYSVSWVKARGDSAGRHTHGPDVIMEGSGMLIATNGKTLDPAPPTNIDNSTKEIHLHEQDWYHLASDSLSKVKKGKKGWIGKAVTHKEFILILYNVERLLVRAKYHTDQIEGSLLSVVMEMGSPSGVGIRNLKSIEQCYCPHGYDGLSCESCLDGYRRVNNTLYGGECRKCNCNNHAKSCDAYTGECHACQHNTRGKNCEQCLPGFYGNPSIGTPLDCQRCACPLEDPRNNFSPTCVLRNEFIPLDYICDCCPDAYAGDRCDVCADGFFGNPLIPGNFCQPCDCSGNVDPDKTGNCDSLTGQCLKCVDNTAGWRCDECRDGYYGNPLTRDCRPCDCNLFGSLNSTCNKYNGQCACKHNYVGRNCDGCAEDYGGITQGCLPCDCNILGSPTQRCDSVSAQCECNPGVFGAKCDSCLDNYYGFSSVGCSFCGCDAHGSVNSTCDIHTGHCYCKPFLYGRTCNQCQIGYWNLISGGGCEECNCNYVGSGQTDCDQTTGQCYCKPGISGRTCAHCSPGYFGFSVHGCRKCAPCDALGHLCHPLTGECVCPPNTDGSACERCKINAWGYDPLEGCKLCECNVNGSKRLQCDSVMGRCTCLEGFEGQKCDRCRFGYFEFPNCKRCRCYEEGTASDRCSALGVCECDDSGQCPCKENVEGRKCRKCKDGTFGLLASHPKGCFECFCFGKTNQCAQSHFIWNQVSTTGEQIVFAKYGHTVLNQTNGLHILPRMHGPVTIGLQHVLSTPIYWQLSEIFLGDKILSYNGRLSFTTRIDNGSPLFSTVLNSYPVVQIQGNFRLILEYYTEHIPLDGRYVVKLHEEYWKLKNNPETPVSRATMMIVLQNVQHIFVRGTDSISFTSAKLFDVVMDTAITPSVASPTAAIGVEICDCPPEYIGTSCQDPAPGYYRKRKPNFLDSKDILDLVGFAVPCDCNGRSKVCDRESGYCLACEDNTSGPYCNLCAQGYFGDPEVEPCQRCACPTVENSFSDTCMLDVFDGHLCTNCRHGYTGRHCERCDHGYYGNPVGPNGKCFACNCDPRGSLGTTCNITTGQCYCLEGITGRDCSKCADRHIITPYGCQSCDDGCVGRLLNDVDGLINILKDTNLTGVSTAPWGRLFAKTNETLYLNQSVDSYLKMIFHTRQIVDTFDVSELEKQANLLFLNAMEMATMTTVDIVKKATAERIAAMDELRRVLKLEKDFQKWMKNLELYGSGTSTTSVNVESALSEAERLSVGIMQKKFTPKRTRAEKELQKAKKLLNSLRRMTYNNTRADQLRDRSNQIRILLDELVNRVTENVRPNLYRTQNIKKENLELSAKLKVIIENVNDLKSEIEKLKDDSGELLNDARAYLNEAHENIGIINDWIQELINATGELERRAGILERFNPEYEEKFVRKAIEHANDLKKLADETETLFAPTREISAQPIEAVQVYQNILDAIEEAREAAQNASELATNVHRAINPPNNITLLLKVAKTVEASEDCHLDATALRDKQLDGVKRRIETSVSKIEKSEANVDKTRKRLKELQNETGNASRSDIAPMVRDTKSKLKTIRNDLASTNQRIEDVNRKIKNELKPQAELLFAGTVAGLGNLSKSVDKSLTHLRNSDQKLQTCENQTKLIKVLESQMQLNLTSLKNKILLARQTASGITSSLKDSNGECVRSYQAEVEPSTTSNIILIYAINSNDNDSILLYLANSKDDVSTVDFMAIEMVNRRIRFIWTSGGPVKSIEHNLDVKTTDATYERDSLWYKIEVVRINNIATLSVQPTPQSGSDDLYKVTGQSSAEYVRMDLDSSSHLYVGGFPDGVNIPAAIKARNFAGCLYELHIDGKKIGLWNFKTNKGCTACKEGASEKPDSDEVFFQGDGYAVFPQIRRLHRRKYEVQMSFKSYDENALIFFTVNPVSNHFFALELRGGKVIFHYQFGNDATILGIISRKLHNTGEWVTVTAQISTERIDESKIELLGSLYVNDERLTSNITVKNTQPVLELKDSEVYFGGVPPNVTILKWKTVGFSGFLGCMKAIQIGLTTIHLVTSKKHYGLESGCKTTGIKVVWLKGDGFLELHGQTLSMNANFAFSFQTDQANALLMMSTFIGKPKNVSQEDYYSVSLSNGQIHCVMNAGEGPVNITTPDTYNDGKFHTISVLKTNKSIKFKVDDHDIKTAQLPSSTNEGVIESPREGGLFFGGVPPEIKGKVKRLASSVEPLNGHIKDVVFNDAPTPFCTPFRFSNVGIGRLKQRSATVYHIPVPFPENKVMQCTEPPKLVLEATAMQFGDNRNSYVQLRPPKTAPGGKFNISFDFRTRYPNGMLLFVKNGNKRVRQYFAVTLRNRRVVLTVQAKERQEIESRHQLNSGEWRKVHLRKQGPNFYLSVDDSKPVEMRGKKKLKVQLPFYIGGIPENLKNVYPPLEENFKGCVRNLNINKKLVDLATGEMSNVSQCFTNVEDGAYFAGDAYAVYDDQFSVGKAMEIELNFKTTRANGILVTVSEEGGFPALALEINDGNVTVTVDKGDGQPFFATKSFSTEAYVCDNKWHTVAVSYHGSSVVLVVDSQKSFGYSKDKLNNDMMTEGPFYIGGLPEDAHPGVLKTRSNFVGCIRNYVINGHRKDWTDMKYRKNILLNTCPTAPAI